LPQQAFDEPGERLPDFQQVAVRVAGPEHTLAPRLLLDGRYELDASAFEFDPQPLQLAGLEVKLKVVASHRARVCEVPPQRQPSHVAYVVDGEPTVKGDVHAKVHQDGLAQELLIEVLRCNDVAHKDDSRLVRGLYGTLLNYHGRSVVASASLGWKTPRVSWPSLVPPEQDERNVVGLYCTTSKAVQSHEHLLLHVGHRMP
jgi:hypothetical protein